MQNFDTFFESWKSDASRLLDTGLEYLQQLEKIPAPFGVFGDFVDYLVELPFTEQHLNCIVALINKQSPYLQESGIELATAFQRDVGEDPKISGAICKLLQRNTLDPWVLKAIVDFVRYYSKSIDDPDNIRLFKSLAQAAYENEYIEPEPFSGNIMRNRAIFPIADARTLLDQVLLSPTHTARARAILPYLEKAYKTSGIADTVREIRSRMSIRR